MEINRRSFLSGMAVLAAAPSAASVGGDAVGRDLVVAGGGPAGIAVAVTAARAGLKVSLFESQGCLGGIWTSGAVSCLIAFNGCELDREIMRRLDAYCARCRRRPCDETSFVFEPEYMKRVVEEMCVEAGVDVHLGSLVVAAETAGREIKAVVTESKSGRRAFAGRFFVDCTGDGDLAARAGCGFSTGGGEGGADQPASLIALLSIPETAGIGRFVANNPANYSSCGDVIMDGKLALLSEFRRLGVEPSYGAPTLFRLRPGFFALMADHEYGVSIGNEESITAATLRARREIFKLTDMLAAAGGPTWKGVRVVATAGQLGLRGSRRIMGRYTLTEADILAGRQFPDAVASSTTLMDVHAVAKRLNDIRPAGDSRGADCVQPAYQIPLRACQSCDFDNLYMAGKCISGDFRAQSSYRMSGLAVAMGVGVARAVRRNCDLHRTVV